MAQVIEVPGMGNVEFPDGMSESDIANAIDTGLAQQKQQNQDASSAADMGMAMAIPAAAAIAPAIPQAVNTATTIASPAVSGAWNAAKGLGGAYLSNPGSMAVDAAAAHLGLPPPVASAKIEPLYKGINQSYVNAKDYINKTGQFTPPSAPAAAPTAVPNEVAQAQALSKSMTPEQLVSHAQSGQSMEQLAAQQAAKPVVGGPAAQEGADFIQRMAQKFAPIAERVAPVLQKIAPIVNNPVTRFAAGPVGQFIQGATYSPSTGPQVPAAGPYRGMEINPTTRRAWTTQELAAYNNQYK